jgi:predicted RNA-binding protein associated with RNAse of E/G family
MVDLDLDVICTFSGQTRLLDEDEFELHRVDLDDTGSHR